MDKSGLTENFIKAYNNNTMKKSGITIDDLGVMIQKEFSRIEDNFHCIDTKLGKLDLIEQNQNEMKLRLNHVAHRFELKDLEDRVTVLEKKTGLA